MKYTQCSLEEAIRMASTNPARLMGLDHLCEMLIQKTIVAGKIVYSK